ncbi:uncharacterized protein K460DRAFT_178465 [Cucurbitaria berberidis CBS 394.84]|uniref:Uncharacterized protein n=1 Tax=Cucurbitaria berberidis CBS 394.84 TaxID=1168544 RepID=A0A9P4L583_9PLEO|nr:uncharacterized protein K460DRAFT_178465 [Cucurbitaria berberidis CBS 394.84]KAF1842077.1 hypothetical protein K460DRAFT_178465 [Cucurbitaria berberidis CBS 394.84]
MLALRQCKSLLELDTMIEVQKVDDDVSRALRSLLDEQHGFANEEYIGSLDQRLPNSKKMLRHQALSLSCSTGHNDIKSSVLLQHYTQLEIIARRPKYSHKHETFTSIHDTPNRPRCQHLPSGDSQGGNPISRQAYALVRLRTIGSSATRPHSITEEWINTQTLTSFRSIQKLQIEASSRW